jgi:hypothetical protein
VWECEATQTDEVSPWTHQFGRPPQDPAWPFGAAPWS